MGHRRSDVEGTGECSEQLACSGGATDLVECQLLQEIRGNTDVLTKVPVMVGKWKAGTLAMEGRGGVSIEGVPRK